MCYVIQFKIINITIISTYQNSKKHIIPKIYITIYKKLLTNNNLSPRPIQQPISIMSTIRAKQQICLNISTIRCLSNYAIGKYCLRFCLYQISSKDNIPVHSKQQGSYQYSSNYRYAIPINVIQYNTKPSQKQNNTNNNQSNTRITPVLSQNQQYIYTTKPFLLKPNTQTHINQLCIFKYDINIFNNKYQHDFHQITMRCICQLFLYQYGTDQGRVVGVFDGRIKGAGIGDAVLIDFYDGIGCQVLGTVHSCVYQFQYVYSGGPVQIQPNGTIKKADMTTMKDSISMNNSQVLVINNNSYIDQYNSQNTSNTRNRNKSIIVPSLTFQMYCQLQTKQYVQSLLQYLLSQVKKSDEKMSLNLQIFSSIFPSTSTSSSFVQGHIKKLPNSPPRINSHSHQSHQQYEQPTILLSSQQYSQQLLQKSIRNQLNLDLQSINNTEMQQRLSIIKTESKYYDGQQDKQEKQEKYEKQEGYIEIVLDGQEQDQDRVNTSVQYNKDNSNRERQRYKNVSRNIYKDNHEQIDNCIVLDQQQQQMQQISRYKSNNNLYINNHNNNNNNNNNRINSQSSKPPIHNEHPLQINLNTIQKPTKIHKQSLPNKQSPIFINLNPAQSITTDNTYKHKAIQQNKEIIKQQQLNKNKKRRKIFVQSNTINNNTTNNNNPISPRYHTNTTSNAYKQKQRYQQRYKQQQKYKYKQKQKQRYNYNNIKYAQKVEQYYNQLQLTNKQSIYQPRQIPKTTIQYHPNHNNSIPTTITTKNKIKTKSKQSILLNSNTSKVTIQQFQKLLHKNCIQIYQKWRKFISYLTKTQSTKLLEIYHLQYRNKLLSLLGQSIIRFKGTFDIDIYSKQQMYRNKMAYQIRDQVYDNQKNIRINQFKFYNKQLFSKNKPIMFQQNYSKYYTTQIQQSNTIKINQKKSFIKLSLNQNNNTINQNQPKHIIFLVHGLGACRIDMEKLRIQMKRYFKEKIHVVLSCANQGRTEGDIGQMGIRLSHQVEQQLIKQSKNFGNLQSSGVKVSFFGHSMGGIIIRSALPKLQKYRNLFHSFVTLSSPHVGYNYSSSKLIDVGLWLINNWKKCQSILQLTMSDLPNNNNQKIQDTFLYKLSLEKGLQWFKKITFLASRQDLYVPYFSARIQKHQQCLNDLRYNNQYAIIHSKMVDNILSRITGSITRIDVNFCITQQSVDNLIGRAAHINFVSNTEFLRLLCAVDQGTLI